MVNYFLLIYENSYLKILAHAFVIVLIALVINLVLDFGYVKKIKKLKKIKSKEERNLKMTRFAFLKRIFSTVVNLLAILFILLLIPGFRTFSISLLAGAGIAAIIIGFAAQKTLSNIVSGISIAFFTPFRVGDRLKIGDDLGDVEDLNLRHTVIKTWDNRRIIIPNSIISEKEIVNYSIGDEKMLWTLDIGISYDSNIDTARKIILEKANNHPENITFEIEEDGEIVKKEPSVYVTDCGDFAVNLKLLFWVDSPKKGWRVSKEILEQIKKEFDSQGIEIPFPYRTIVYKSDLDKRNNK